MQKQYLDLFICSLAVSLVLTGAILAATVPHLQWKLASEPFCLEMHTIFLSWYCSRRVHLYENTHCNAIIG